MLSKRNRVLESDCEKKRQTISGLTIDNLDLANLLRCRITGGGRVLEPQTTPQGRPTLPPDGSKCKLVITGLKWQTSPVLCMCSTRETKKRFKCPECKVVFCVYLDKI
jgi:hypothetical protein